MSLDPRIFRPQLDSAEWPAESEAEYIRRIQPLFPNFPPDVIGQWFYDHWTQAADWSEWLDYRSLSFERQEWSTGQVPLKEFGYEELFAGHVARIARGDCVTPRDESLLTYFRANGTWPRPIIVLRQDTLVGARPPWMEDGRHYVLEGHHRVAVFRVALQSGLVLKSHHAVWLVASP